MVAVKIKLVNMWEALRAEPSIMYLLRIISSAINLLCDLEQDPSSLWMLASLFVKQRGLL